MSYTAIAVLTAVLVLVVDLFVLRTRMVRRRDFWIAYAIMLFFQILTNAVLTGTQTVRYADRAIVGVGNDVAAPPMLGDGRFFFAPMEDLAFGFGLVLLTVAVWDFLGGRGLQPGPRSGPPLWRRSPPGTPGE
ncbi:MAG: lycopene cyclase domain-containing protein [Candidatus Nanopelagicales bacterium]